MATADNTTATIKVTQDVIEKALVAHLFGEMLTQPESRDQLLHDLVTQIMSQPEHSYDKESLLQRTVKSVLAKRINEIAAEWLATPEAQATIRAKVEELLAGDYVSEYLTKMLALATERMKRNF